MPANMAMVKMTVMKCIKKTSLNVGKISLLYADSADILMSVKVLTLVKHIGVHAIWGRGGKSTFLWLVA